MAMGATYTSFAGAIVKENRGGAVKRYVADTLGSTAKLTDASGTVTDSFEYWPYGEERSRTGTTATPFTFVGTLGYHKDQAGRLYVRARTYLAKYARWLTVDPLWPDERVFEYVGGRPIDRLDPLGLAACSSDCDKGGPGSVCQYFLTLSGHPTFPDGTRKGGWVVCCNGKCYECMSPVVGFGPGSTPGLGECLMEHERNHCSRQPCANGAFGEPDCRPDCGTDECLAAQAELACLVDFLNRCTTADCQKSIEDRMRAVCAYRHRHCQSVGMGNRIRHYCMGRLGK